MLAQSGLASDRAGCVVVGPLRAGALWFWSRAGGCGGGVGHVLAVELVPRPSDPVASQSRGWTGAADGSPDARPGRPRWLP